ncbi:MAG: AI-2E family transporter [Armatimonadota bacterium]
MSSGERQWLRYVLWAAVLIAAAWVLSRLSTLVVMAIVVGIVTFPIFPMTDWLERRWRISRAGAAALTLLTVFGVFILGLIAVVPWIVQQVQVLIRMVPPGFSAVSEFLSHWQTRVAEPTFPQFLRTAWERAGEAAVATANAALAGLVNVTVSWFGQLYLVLLLPFMVYFVLVDYRNMRESALAMLSRPARQRMEGLLARLSTTLRWGLWAQVVVSSIVAALTAIGLAAVGVPGPLAIGVFAGVAEAIPYVGGFATYGVALLVAAPAGGRVWIGAVIVVTVVKVLANVLVPLVLGRMTQTHPLAIIVALLVLGELFGLLGMFFAVPVVVIVREILAWWRPAHASE